MGIERALIRDLVKEAKGATPGHAATVRRMNASPKGPNRAAVQHRQERSDVARPSSPAGSHDISRRRGSSRLDAEGVRCEFRRARPGVKAPFAGSMPEDGAWQA
ncbi:hypothetical protein GCM10025780_30300 [Frondihabitans cladoniiphilus]|uniref:Uncharacterized protein n=1 Tax=Frondihabitans cladoniiphilus TaxID=715785 RepID=A0ABP8W6T6_9MICO